MGPNALANMTVDRSVSHRIDPTKRDHLSGLPLNKVIVARKPSCILHIRFMAISFISPRLGDCGKLRKTQHQLSLTIPLISIVYYTPDPCYKNLGTPNPVA